MFKSYKKNNSKHYKILLIFQMENLKMKISTPRGFNAHYPTVVFYMISQK